MKYEEILGNCIEEGDCLLWQGGMSGGTYPCMRFDGKFANVRTVLWRASGRSLPAGKFVGVRCQNKRCVGCLYLKKSRSEGSTPRLAVHRRSMSMKARLTHGKLTEAVVREIRISSESSSALAARYSVVKSTINDARYGRTWKDYSNPFAGLGA